MAWIELHQTLPQNKKTMKLKRLLKIKTPQAVGHLAMLWLWALDNADDGDLSEFDAADIAEICEYTGKDAQVFVDALIASGFLDKDMTLHSWGEYVEKLVERRTNQKAYKERKYNLYNNMRLTKQVKNRDGDICQYCGCTVNWNDRKGATGGTYDFVNPLGENIADNIVVTCRSCRDKKKGLTPDEAGMKFIEKSKCTVNKNQILDKSTADLRQIKSAITVPNRTQPVNNSRHRRLYSARENPIYPKIVCDGEDWIDGLSDRLSAMNAYLGVTEEFKNYFYELAQSLFGQYFDETSKAAECVKLFEAVAQDITVYDSNNRVFIEVNEDYLRLLEIAFETAVSNGRKTVAYVAGIMRNWRNNGIRTVDDYENHEAERNG